MRYITSVLLLLYFTEFCTIAQKQKATITTDKDDYWPGEWVIITGTSWQNDDSVQLTLTHLDPLPDPYHTHNPWFVAPDADGEIYYKWFVPDQELGTSFELGALGFAQGIPTSDFAVTYFMDASITDVTINESSFCDGQPVTVSYKTSNSGGKFGNDNFFTAQLSNASGSFSTPVIIGNLQSKQSGVINAIIPSGTANGTHYRIRVVSSSPVITSNPNEADLTVNVSPTAPAFLIATPPAICAGGSSNLNATSEGNSIRWYTTDSGGSPLGTSENEASFSVTPLITTIYYAESLNAAGCSSSARRSVTVTVNTIPTITSTSPGSVCGIGTVTLAATSSAGIINWYSEANGGVILGTGISFATPIITLNTTYYVDATANGCVATTRTAIKATVNSAPAAPIAGTVTQPTCAVSTGSVVLNGLPATGTWILTRTPGGTITSGTGTSTTITGLVAGTYTFTVTNSSGCSSTGSANVVINAQSATPPANAGSGGNECDLNFKFSAIASIGTGIWIQTAGTGTSTFIPDANTPDATVTVSAYGNYTFAWTETNNTCSKTSIINVNFYQQPVANAGTGGNNCGLEFYLGATPSIGTGIWTLVNGTGTATFSPNANTANAKVTVTAYGTHTFRWTEVNGACSNSATISINFYQQSSANAGNGGDECDMDFILNAVPGAVPGTWTKVGGPGNAVFSPAANQANAKVTVSQFGSYDFAWTEANTLCASTDIVRVTFHDLPSINAGADTAVCKGGSIQLNAIGSGSFQWAPANLVNNQTISNPVATPVSSSVFTVILTDQWGCKNSDQISIEVREQPVANAGPDQVLEYMFETTLNVATLGNGQTGEWTIISGTGEFASKNDNAAYVSKLSLDKNIFKWTLTNGVCPSSSDTVNIIVHDLIIPTLITPNNDGRNDYFIIKGIETFGKTEFVIFNRWGARVYLNDNYDNKWNGVDDNVDPLPDDTYFFVIRPEKSKPVRGYIVIRR